MTTLILAAGIHERFPGTPKQLLDIAGETVLARMIRQAKAAGLGKAIIVTRDPVIFDMAVNSEGSYYAPDAHRWTCETLLNTRGLWYDRIVVLLGDVIYSREAMRVIATFPSTEPFVFSNGGEIFALSFGPDQYSEIAEGLTSVVWEAELGGCNAKLWCLYRLLTGVPIDQHLFRPGAPSLVWIDDYTTDIDTPEEYEAFCRDVIAAGVLDDLPERVGDNE